MTPSKGLPSGLEVSGSNPASPCDLACPHCATFSEYNCMLLCDLDTKGAVSRMQEKGTRLNVTLIPALGLGLDQTSLSYLGLQNP